jgi:hypothetical protein
MRNVDMGFLKSLFKSGCSKRPEDYDKIYFRWEIGGQEYGPLFFDDMITRNWSGPPIEGRYENEDNWRKYKYFLKILDNLMVSQDQLGLLRKYDISVDELSLKFRDALKMIEEKKEELRIKRSIEKKKKEKLPATKNTLKKLESYGIKYSDNITRSEAKLLISSYDEKEQVKQIISNFKKRGIDLSSKFDMDVVIEESVNNISFTEHLEELNELLMKLSKFNVAYSLPEKLSAESIFETNNKIENALFDAEDAEEQIKERFFSTLEADYKIIGKLPKNNIRNFIKDVIENHLQGNWDFERDILKLLRKHFPEIKLKED